VKLTAHLNVGILCAGCFWEMYPLPAYIPRRVVCCVNEKCPRFHVAMEVTPLEFEAVEAKDILSVNPE
jgi:hypothetical protein